MNAKHMEIFFLFCFCSIHDDDDDDDLQHYSSTILIQNKSFKRNEKENALFFLKNNQD